MSAPDDDIAYLYEDQEPVRAWPEPVGWVVLNKHPAPNENGIQYASRGAVFPTLERAQKWRTQCIAVVESNKTRGFQPSDPEVELVIGEIRERPLI